MLLAGGEGVSGCYEVLAHTADVGISTRAGSLNALIGNARFAIFDLKYDLDAATPETSILFELTIAPPADLLVKVLEELQAVTYHDLVCEESENGWRSRLIFDV